MNIINKRVLSRTAVVLLLAPVSPLLAQDTTPQTGTAVTNACDYTDAANYAGWGWNPVTGQSCAPITVAPTTEATDSTTNNPDECVDPDGDGWGWNGSASCQVTTASPVNNTDDVLNCVDTAPVGDGWGWDGSASCRVTTASPVNNTDDVTNCVDTAPVGDGWGWDGSASCRLGAYNDGPANSDGIEESYRNQLAQTVIIPRIYNAPLIDGVIDDDEWAQAVETDVTNQKNWIDNLIVHERGDYSDYGPCTYWSAMHDGTYLYIRIANHEEPGTTELWQDSKDAYQDDSIEIFLDGNNSKLSSYDGVDDYMFALRYDDSMSNFVDWGARGSRTDLQFTYATSQAFHLPNDYANYEIAIRMDSAGIYPGDLIGLEIQINEDDDGGDRDAKWSWAERTAEHRAWFDPSAFGTVKLAY